MFTSIFTGLCVSAVLIELFFLAVCGVVRGYKFAVRSFDAFQKARAAKKAEARMAEFTAMAKALGLSVVPNDAPAKVCADVLDVPTIASVVEEDVPSFVEEAASKFDLTIEETPAPVAEEPKAPIVPMTPVKTETKNTPTKEETKDGKANAESKGRKSNAKHYVGEINTETGKVFTEYAPGKFGWRSVKGASAKTETKKDETASAPKSEVKDTSKADKPTETKVTETAAPKAEPKEMTDRQKAVANILARIGKEVVEIKGISAKIQNVERTITSAYMSTDTETGVARLWLTTDSAKGKKQYSSKEAWVSQNAYEAVLEYLVKNDVTTEAKPEPKAEPKAEAKPNKAQIVEDILKKLGATKSSKLKDEFEVDNGIHAIRVKKVFVNGKAKDVEVVFQDADGNKKGYPICGTSNMTASLAGKVLAAMY